VRGELLGERSLPPSGGTITERVTYDDLIIDNDYVFEVDLENPDGSQTGIRNLASLTPTETSGTIDLELTVPSGYAGRTLIATVTLYDVVAFGPPIARHADLTDAQQTLVIRAPLIRSSLTDEADGDQVLAVTGGTLVDSVSFEQLEPGTEYTVTSELIRASDASPTSLAAAQTFTPSEADGSVELSFDVPSGYAGQTLVSFSRLYIGTDESVIPLAEDGEIDDATQTVVVEAAPTPGSPATNPAAAAPAAMSPRVLAASGITSSPGPIVLAALLLAAGVALLIVRRRHSAD
ncbi:MAG: VaFE repeat-containing surface-anchored protein, partial [Microbacterium sp.]